MTARDSFGTVLLEARRWIWRGLWMFVVSGVVSTSLEILGLPEWLVLGGCLTAFTGIGCIICGFYIIIKKVRCTECSAGLSHLVLDYSYSKKVLILHGLPTNIPDDICDCPYCHASLDA